MENIELDSFVKKHFVPEWYYDEIFGLVIFNFSFDKINGFIQY